MEAVVGARQPNRPNVYALKAIPETRVRSKICANVPIRSLATTTAHVFSTETTPSFVINPEIIRINETI